MPTTPPLSPELFDLSPAPDAPPGTPAPLWVMHCAKGPVPRAASIAVESFLPRERRPWEMRWEEDFQGIPAGARTAAAALVEGEVDDVTLTATTSTGLVTLAQGYPWQAGHEVLLPAGEFPANLWPWRAVCGRRGRGVCLVEVPLWDGHRSGAEAWGSAPPPPEADPEARLLAACGERTRVLAVSWVRFQDGLVLDLPRLAAGCAERGIDLVVDGIQGAGTLRVPLEGLAAFASGGHKGLLAPQGLGFLWTSPDLRRRLQPTGSWLSVEEATDFDRPSTDFDRSWLADGRRLEAGVPNLVGATALRASLETVVDAGVEAIAAHGAELRRLLLEGLADVPGWRSEAERLSRLDAAGRLGPIVALHHGGRGADGLGRLLAAGVERGIHASVREGYLRIAFHGWHTEDDVGRLVDWLRDAG